MRLLLVFFLCGCILTVKGQHLVIADRPRVDLSIKLVSDTFKVGQLIKVKITISNNQQQALKLLFDKPELWGFTARAIDLSKGESVLAYPSKAVFSSQIYSEEQLKKYYYRLKPGQSIETESSLEAIAVIKTDNYRLPKGKYQMQLDYQGNTSNSVIFIITE